jgi:protoporphyrinogen IX oxidase
MRDLLTVWYPWLKAFHILAVIAWMAAMLYLPRLFVYHCAAAVGSAQSETFKVMERRLAKAIMTPAMIATWVLGILLTGVPGLIDWSSDGWIHAKLALVLAMTGFHGVMSGWRKAFEQDRNTKSARYFRIANEVPTLGMIAIVILVVVKPF